MTPRKKLIEVALPLEAINEASAREKSIRHGHPSTLHLWWARRPLAACRAVIFTSLVDDPDDQNAPPEFVEACRKLRKGANASVEDTPRQRLFDFIELLVQWESTTDEDVLETARELIRLSTDGNPPPLLDPFAGGGSIPLEAQRLGLEAHASDLNPVAVMINKALIEIPPRFANMPPVNPRDQQGTAQGMGWKGAQGLAADVRYYGEWMRDRAWERIGHLYPKYTPHPPAPSPTRREGEQDWEREVWEIPPELERRMRDVARDLRREPTPSEDVLWQAIRKQQLDGRKFRRQMPIGPFVVDFYCSSERLVVEIDGPIHDAQREADHARQMLLESLGIRFVRVTAHAVEHHLPDVLDTIRAAFIPSLLVGEGNATDRSQGMGGETVIAWLWARTVKCPNPACGAQMPLARSFVLSKKKGRKAWVEPVVERGDSLTLNPSPSSGEGLHTRAPLPSPAAGRGAGGEGPRIRFEVRTGQGTAREGTVNRRGATCIACGSPVPLTYIRNEAQSGRIASQMMAIVTEGENGRSYYAPDEQHSEIARQAQPSWKPDQKVTTPSHDVDRLPMYGMYTWGDAFTPRQLIALTTFSDLVNEARKKIHEAALTAGLPNDDLSLQDGGTGAKAYSEAMSVYLAFAVDRHAPYCCALATWHSSADKVRATFARQAISMAWDYCDVNSFSSSTGCFADNFVWIAELDFAHSSGIT